MGCSSLFKDPPAALAPIAVIRSGMTTFRTFHDLGTYSLTTGSMSHTGEAVSQTEVGDRLATRLAGCVRAAQPGKGTIGRPLLSESVI